MIKHISLDDPGPEDCLCLSTLSTLISKSTKFIIVTGAGIFCNAGIPVHHLEVFHLPQDFRSKDGLYNVIKMKYPETIVRGKDLFDISILASTTTASIYYTFMALLHQEILSAEPTPTHKFIRNMHEQQRLVWCYTQNFDGIESKVGLLINEPRGQLYQLHGDIHTLQCNYCDDVRKYTKEWMDLLQDGMAPKCPECTRKCIPH